MIIFQSSLASHYESRDEFTLQVCDHMIYALQRRENVRESLRKFSKLDDKYLLLCTKKKEVDRYNNNIFLRFCSYTTEDTLQS